MSPKPISSISASITTSEAASDLLARARRGDRAAYSRLVLLHQNQLFNAIFHLVGDLEEASELAHETFARGLARLGEIAGDPVPYTWFLRIALNLAVISLRKSRRRRAFMPPENSNPDDGADRQVMEALGRLETDYRAILVLRDMENLDYSQIADVLTLPAPAVKSRLFRARLALWDELPRQLTD